MKLKLKKVHIKTWQLLLILLPLVFFTATLLRFDHIRMTELRTAVLEADKSGDADSLSSSLSELKSFVNKNIIINITEKNGSSVVSFGTGPFYLEGSYRRAAEVALKEAEKKLTGDDNPNGNVYALASDVCREAAIANGWTWSDEAYINCMTSEIQKYPSSAEIIDTIKADIPSTEIYRLEFASPIWVFSLSGFFVLLCIVLSVVIITRFIIWIILRLSLLIL